MVTRYTRSSKNLKETAASSLDIESRKLGNRSAQSTNADRTKVSIYHKNKTKQNKNKNKNKS
jgi:hypothetical protein